MRVQDLLQNWSHMSMLLKMDNLTCPRASGWTQKPQQGVCIDHLPRYTLTEDDQGRHDPGCLFLWPSGTRGIILLAQALFCYWGNLGLGGFALSITLLRTIWVKSLFWHSLVGFTWTMHSCPEWGLCPVVPSHELLPVCSLSEAIRLQYVARISSSGADSAFSGRLNQWENTKMTL